MAFKMKYSGKELQSSSPMSQIANCVKGSGSCKVRFPKIKNKIRSIKRKLHNRDHMFNDSDRDGTVVSRLFTRKRKNKNSSSNTNSKPDPNPNTTQQIRTFTPSNSNSNKSNGESGTTEYITSKENIKEANKGLS
jgi:hypothetical protein